MIAALSNKKEISGIVCEGKKHEGNYSIAN